MKKKMRIENRPVGSSRSGWPTLFLWSFCDFPRDGITRVSRVSCAPFDLLIVKASWIIVSLSVLQQLHGRREKFLICQAGSGGWRPIRLAISVGGELCSATDGERNARVCNNYGF